MADSKDVNAPALDTNIESGNFDEKKQAPPAQPTKTKEATSDEDEDEDMDALIEDLESQDGHGADDEEEEHSPAQGRVVPEDMLQTDSRMGLTDSEVTARRRKYGLNQMKEEKENLILKFFGYFVGPIQFVMEVSLLLFLFSHSSFLPVLLVALFVRFCAYFISPPLASTMSLVRLLMECNTNRELVHS